MSDHFDVVVVAWMFLALIGAWVLVNALIDLVSKRFRSWVTERWNGQAATLERVARQTRESR
jgi:hypothetical protein